MKPKTYWSNKQGNIYRRLRKAYAEALNAGYEEEGSSWYPRAFEIASEVHANPIIGAGIISALSPRCSWEINVDWTKKISKRIGSSVMPNVSTFRNRERAWRIAHLVDPTKEDILEILGGPKVTRFFRNIVGETHPVTIDSWTAFIAEGHRRNLTHIDGNRYRVIESAFQSFSRETDHTPREVQAILWIHERSKSVQDNH